MLSFVVLHVYLHALPATALYLWQGFLREKHSYKETFQGGSSILSNDGNHAFISATSFTDYAGDETVLNAFRRSFGSWHFDSTITTCGIPSYAAAVDIAHDEKTLVVGCLGRPSHAKILVEEQRGKWKEWPLLCDGGNGTFDEGTSVAISWDGSTAVVGGPKYDRRRGAVWVFVKKFNQWQPQGSKLFIQGTERRSEFGASLALSGDGNTLAIGAYGDNMQAGAVYVFARNFRDEWRPIGPKLVMGDSTEHGKLRFGFSVTLSYGGDVLLAGAPGATEDMGRVFAFARENHDWVKQSDVIPHDVIGSAKVGYVSSISHSGNVALICGPDDDGGKGACWIFTRCIAASGTSKTSKWIQRGPKYRNKDNCTRCIGRTFGRSGFLTNSMNDFIIGGFAYGVDANRRHNFIENYGGAEVYHSHDVFANQLNIVQNCPDSRFPLLELM